VGAPILQRSKDHRCRPPGIVPKLAENPGFVTNRGEIRRETDSLLEGDGFELPIPRARTVKSTARTRGCSVSYRGFGACSASGSESSPTLGWRGWVPNSVPQSGRIEACQLALPGSLKTSLVEEAGFEPVWGFSCQVVIFWFAAGSLFGAGRPFFVPSPAIRFAERAEGVKGPKR
jgi:hypothetical protein